MAQLSVSTAGWRPPPKNAHHSPLPQGAHHALKNSTSAHTAGKKVQFSGSVSRQPQKVASRAFPARSSSCKGLSSPAHHHAQARLGAEPCGKRLGDKEVEEGGQWAALADAGVPLVAARLDAVGVDRRPRAGQEQARPRHHSGGRRVMCGRARLCEPCSLLCSMIKPLSPPASPPLLTSPLPRSYLLPPPTCLPSLFLSSLSAFCPFLLRAGVAALLFRRSRLAVG